MKFNLKLILAHIKVKKLNIKCMGIFFFRAVDKYQNYPLKSSFAFTILVIDSKSKGNILSSIHSLNKGVVHV